jgi:hypothetical protein
MPPDHHFLRSVLPQLGDRVLEVGSRNWQGPGGNMRETVEATGRSWEGCDLEEGPEVDFTIDILDPARVAAVGRTWPAVLLFNLLEHVYDPTTALRHAMTLVEPGGACVVCGPVVWELHDYPADYWRPLPDFFTAFARREGHTASDLTWALGEETWLPKRPATSRLIAVDSLQQDGKKQLPSRYTSVDTYGRLRTAISVSLQRGLQLTGRGWRFPNLSLGVVLHRGR